MPLKAPEVVKKRGEQVAPRVAELAVAPVPVAPKKKKNRNPPKVAEADGHARSLRAQTQFLITSP